MGMVHNTTTPDIETASENYRRRFAGALGSYFLKVQEDAVRSCLGVLGTGPLRILEVGGGHGQTTEFLLKAGHEVWVQGSAAECFGRLQVIAAEYKDRLHFLSSPLWTIPAADRSFDAVIALRLLAHVERWTELLTEMSRLSNRLVIVDFPVRNALNALTPWLFGVKKRIEGNTRPYFSYSTGEVARQMQKLGFGPAMEIRQFFFPMGLHRAVGSPGATRAIETCAKISGLTAVAGSPIVLSAARQTPTP